MPNSWKISAYDRKVIIQDALIAHEVDEEFDPTIVITGFEVLPHEPDDWVLEAYLPRKPTKADKASFAGLFSDDAPKLVIEELPETDWVTESQQGVDPIRAGRFYVRTAEHDTPRDQSLTDFVIPASQAFGTGQHETTAGCLAMLDLMKRQGVIVRNHADIGTGTGLLAFAAMDLWPDALATASDIDPVCEDVVEVNAVTNHFALGDSNGELLMVTADGMIDPVLEVRGPYDLLIANILAGPLVELAPEFSNAVIEDGHILLAGLLTEQEPDVRRAYRRAGFRLAKRLVNGDWSILWLRKRTSF
ncbi:50S ribosomal protein L11 methyltransferase [Altererythrobacter sp. ZODW24]|uniref:50S ribosomal protein L11 methyltransferase n=1 Tax=Altererythrobacter sp. ZODW24 TaxID=2185142 RepID=UPI000DF80745|nr:50S ribosomal protein L11 methyltransferase [Altererythrobacter sp. ZODW24]